MGVYWNVFRMMTLPLLRREHSTATATATATATTTISTTTNGITQRRGGVPASWPLDDKKRQVRVNTNSSWALGLTTFPTVGLSRSQSVGRQGDSDVRDSLLIHIIALGCQRGKSSRCTSQLTLKPWREHCDVILNRVHGNMA